MQEKTISRKVPIVCAQTDWNETSSWDFKELGTEYEILIIKIPEIKIIKKLNILLFLDTCYIILNFNLILFRHLVML